MREYEDAYSIKLNKEDSEIFMEYLNSALRDNDPMIIGSAKSYYDNENYILERSCKLNYNDKLIDLNFKFSFNNTDSLFLIEWYCINEKDSKLINVFISDILQKVINNEKKDYFQRRYYKTISGNNLLGEYWLNGYRVAPLYPEDKSGIVNSERVIVIDKKVKAIDIMHAQTIADREFKIFSAYLSFIIDIELKEPEYNHVYVLDKSADSLKMKRVPNQFVDNNKPEDMPVKGELCDTVRFQGSIFDIEIYDNQKLRIPQETRKILRGIKESNTTVKKAFTNACILYRISKNIGSKYPTSQLSYKISAIEAIQRNMKYKEIKGFTDFMLRYSEIDKQICDFLYESVRSAHFHSGELVLGELNFYTERISNPEYRKIEIIKEIANKEIRVAILNWLKDQIDFD